MSGRKTARQRSFFRLFSRLGVCLFFLWYDEYLCCSERALFNVLKVLASMKTSIQDRRERLPLTHEQNLSKQNHK